jgi:hypothetical protein
MEENDIIKTLELAKYDELQNLQWKVEYLRNEVTSSYSIQLSYAAMNDC